MSPFQLSCIETGHRHLSLDHHTAIAAALGSPSTSSSNSSSDSDVVIRPERDDHRGLTTWLLSTDDGPYGLTVGKMRITDRAGNVTPDDLGVHPGRDWFTVLSGIVVLCLGERVIGVETG